MALLPYVYLGYMFVSLYLLSLFVIIYLRNRRGVFWSPETKKKYTVSLIVPAYNEGKTIRKTIESIFDIDYPYIKEVFVVNDGSTDNTRQEVEKLLKKYPKLKLINNKKNLGNAAKSQNVALRYATGELIAVLDADSYPAKDSLGKMVGWFDDKKVGVVTCPSEADKTENFIEKLQAIEYHVIAFTRKLLDYLDAIYVAPGTLALYRAKALRQIKGFDEKNMTQDIEATWHLTYYGWQRRMSLDTRVKTTVMDSFKGWFKQRRRWNVGGLQSIWKYKNCFFKRGMLGFFILPFFVIQLFLGLIGLAIFFYIFIKNILSTYIFTSYSFAAGTSLLTLQDLYITPSFLNYMGIVLFVLGTIFTFIGLIIMKYNVLKRQNLFNIAFFLLVYLTVYPFIMIDSIYHALKGRTKWR